MVGANIYVGEKWRKCAKPGLTDWEMKDSKFSLFFIKHLGRVS